MGLSRKRKKQLTKLKKTAAALWEEQQAVLVHAGEVGREAGRQVEGLSREEVVPLVRHTVDARIKPAVATGYLSSKAAVTGAKNKVLLEVLPEISKAVAALEILKDPRVAGVLDEVSKTSSKVTKNATQAFAEASKKGAELYETVGTKAGFVKPKPAPKAAIGVGGWVLIVLGVVAVVGVAYAAWQTLRADDELWVLDEKDDSELPE